MPLHTLLAPSDIQRLVGALLSPGGVAELPSDTLAPASAEALATYAGRHLVAAALWGALAARGRTDLLPPEIGGYLEATHALNRRRNAALLAQGGEIASLMASSGIDAVFLKGMALLLIGVHADPATRFVGDIDLLVAHGSDEPAAAALERAGYSRLPDPGPGVHDRLKLVRRDRPGMIELHTATLPGGLGRILPAEAVRAEAVTVATIAGPARVPGRDHRALHCVAHAMLHHGACRQADLPIRDAHDLAFLAQAGEIDWDRLASLLSAAPEGPAALDFCLAATRTMFPDTLLPARPLTPGGATTLARWQRRRGRLPGATGFALANLREHARSEVRWLRASPANRRRALSRLFEPGFYLRYLRALRHFVEYGPAHEPVNR